MRKRDKLKNYEQANLMLEQSYLKSKGLLKEEVDFPKFRDYMEQLAKNFKFNLKSGEIITAGSFIEELKKNTTKYLGKFNEKNGNYEKEGLIYVGGYEKEGYKQYEVIVGTTNKALIKSIQDNFIKNYSKFTSGDISKGLETGKSATVKIDPKSEDSKEFFDFVGKLIDSNSEIAGAGMELKLDNVKNYIKNKGMQGKKMYVGLIPAYRGRDSFMMAYSDEKVFKDFTSKLFGKFNKLEVLETITEKDNEGNDVKIALVHLDAHNTTTKSVAKGSQGTAAVSKAFQGNVSSILKSKTTEGVEIFYTGQPFYVR